MQLQLVSCAQFSGFGSRLAHEVRLAVMKRLEEAGVLKAPYQPHGQPEVPMQLWRLATPLLSREEEVQLVLRSLLEHSAAVIWGGPGEGKSSIAMEAGCRLWESGKCLGGCFQVDLNGELAASCNTKTPLQG